MTTRPDVRRVTVPGPRPYDVVIGSGLFAELGPLLRNSARAAVVYPAPLAGVVDAVVAELGRSVATVGRIEVADGEPQKDIAVAAQIWDALAALGMTRTDTVVAVGGGATTDVAGFVAATWLRGVRIVHVPTTLLAMVDAAVGGKTGINIGAGKNLVGAIHAPAGVLCDLDRLAALPRADYLAGLAEVVKVGFTHDPAILTLLEEDLAAAGTPGGPHTRQLVERAIAVKAEVVGRDLAEQGEREFLNYGHTLAHAIERTEEYRWRHGDAVSIGLLFAAELGRLSGRLAPGVADRHRAVLAGLGLPVSYRGDWSALHDAMRLDKKSRGSRLRFVVLDDLGSPGILDDPSPELLQAAYARICTWEDKP